MTRHAVLWNSGSRKDSVRVYTQETSVLTILERKDLSVFMGLPESRIPGVYILIGKNRRYVGQASTEIRNRVRSHDKNKDWWTTLVVFSRKDGHLDKSQLDRLEYWLFEKFSDLGYDLENNFSIPPGYISSLQRAQAENLLATVESISKDSSLDLFNRNLVKSIESQSYESVVVYLTDEKKSNENTQHNEESIADKIDEFDKTEETFISKVVLASKIYDLLENQDLRSLYADYLRKLWPKNHSVLIKELSSPIGISRIESVDRSEANQFLTLDSTYAFYNRLDDDDIKAQIIKIAPFVGDEVILEITYKKPLEPLLVY